MILRNFLFHRVSEDTDLHWPPMKPATFRETLRQLKERYTIVRFEEFMDGQPGDGKKPFATVMFDDGYKDNLEVAAPILQEMHVPASLYVVTNCINTGMPPWTYLLDDVLQRTSATNLELDDPRVPENLRKICLKHQESRKLKPFLKQLSHVNREELLKEIFRQTDDVSPEKKMMNWEEVRQLKAAGFEIGSHSHTHPMLATLSTLEEIENELVLSKKIIEEKLSFEPSTISYPNGSYDDRVKEAAGKAGYRYGLAVDFRFYNDARDSIYSIPRVELYEEPSWKKKLRITGAYQVIKKLLR